MADATVVTEWDRLVAITVVSAKVSCLTLTKDR